MMKALDDINEKLKALPTSVIAIAQGADEDMLEAVQAAAQECLAQFILIGDEIKIRSIAENKGYSLEGASILHCTDVDECARMSVSLVRNGTASMPMKGLMPTAAFMKAVLDKENGLRTQSLVSQITITDAIGREGLLYITDCAMNISPNLLSKKQILENAVSVARILGISCPKVAVITALETVNEAMPETIDAALLSKMNDRGQIKNCLVDGPFALDNAISIQSAKHKGISGKVAGNADILLMTDIRMGNVFHKALTYFAGKKVASVIAGTSSPVIMSSRSDTVEDKLLSIAFSCYINQTNCAIYND